MTAPTDPRGGAPRPGAPPPGEPAAGARRPHREPLPRTWFLRTRAYRWYALREVSAVVLGLYAVNLAVGLIALHRGPDSWARWVDAQAHPVGVGAGVVALAAALVHAVTWLLAMPKAVRIRRGRRYLAGRWVVLAGAVSCAAVSAVVLLWVGGAW